MKKRLTKKFRENFRKQSSFSTNTVTVPFEIQIKIYEAIILVTYKDNFPTILSCEM